MKKNIFALSAFSILAGCAPQYEAMDNFASQTKQDIACKSETLESKFWDGLKEQLIQTNQAPNSAALKKQLRTAVEQLQAENPSLSASDAADLSELLNRLVNTILEEAPAGEGAHDPKQLLMLISAMDVGDRSTEHRSKMQDSVLKGFTDVKGWGQSHSLNCTPPGTPPGTDQESTPAPDVTKTSGSFQSQKENALAKGMPVALFGARWTLATAYQTCESVVLPPMTEQSPDLEGLKIIGKHPDGVGSKRVIASLPEVQKSHYYLRDVKNYQKGCFNVRANPLVYDYGGKPYATTSATSALDFFKNSGDGTNVLGVDCSGYIFSAMATAGLKLKEGRALKASDAWAWGSSSYVEPQKNGLTCLNKITVSPSSSLASGDIVAVYGHMLMIDEAGSDPFGIESARSEVDCGKITSERFDFVVIQSSNSKEGLGINRYKAKDYFPTSDKMKSGLEKYAYYACMARVTGRSYTPNLGTLSVVRHKGSKECIAPRVSLVNESCIQACSRL